MTMTNKPNHGKRAGFMGQPKLQSEQVEKLLYGRPLPDLNRQQKPISNGAIEARENMARLLAQFNQAGGKP